MWGQGLCRQQQHSATKAPSDLTGDDLRALVVMRWVVAVDFLKNNPTLSADDVFDAVCGLHEKGQIVIAAGGEGVKWRAV